MMLGACTGAALDSLITVVYRHLRQIAGSLIRGQFTGGCGKCPLGVSTFVTHSPLQESVHCRSWHNAFSLSD
jgi:hypothetical protein